MNATQFLNDELGHAERQLARVRRIAAQMEQQLLGSGISEIDAAEKLAHSKAYRQLRRDEVVFQQMWLRTHRHLLHLTPAKTPAASSVDQLLADLESEAQASKPQPYRKPPTPGPNQPCSCGSRLKYKKCCGNPLRRPPALAA